MQFSDGVRLLNKRQAAAVVGVCPKTFSVVVKGDSGPPVTLINKREMFRTDILADWIERRTAARPIDAVSYETLGEALASIGDCPAQVSQAA